MDFETFREQFDPVHSTLTVFRALPPDPPSTDVDIEEAEHVLRCRLGRKYKAVLTTYGGGKLGYCVLLSPSPHSKWSIVHEHTLVGLRQQGWVAFSPNFTGDYYVFRVENGVAQDEVFFYDHETGDVNGPRYADVFEYILARNVRD